MARSLWDRLSTWLRAEAHGALEGVEERGLLVRQHLRDAELELLQKRARVEALAEEAARTRAAAAQLAPERARLDEDVALALAGGKDDLARFALRRLLALRREGDALETQAAELADARARLAATLAEQEAELERLRASARAFCAVRGRSPGDDPLAPPPIADEEVELELLRRRTSSDAGPAAPAARPAAGEETR